MKYVLIITKNPWYCTELKVRERNNYKRNSPSPSTLTSTTSGLEQICLSSAIFIRRWSWKIQSFSLNMPKNRQNKNNKTKSSLSSWTRTGVILKMVLWSKTFFFLLETPPFSFCCASCSSSSESESAFLFAAASGIVSSFLVSWKLKWEHKIIGREKELQIQWKTVILEQLIKTTFTSEPAASLKLNLSKTFLNSSSKSPSNSAVSGMYSTSTCSKACQENNTQVIIYAPGLAIKLSRPQECNNNPKGILSFINKICILWHKLKEIILAKATNQYPREKQQDNTT